MLVPYGSTPSHSGESTIALTMLEVSAVSPMACASGSAPNHRRPERRSPDAWNGWAAEIDENSRRSSPPDGSHLTATREYRRVGHHRMSNQLLPPGAVDRRVNDARSSSEPKDSSLDEQHANRRRPEKLH